jgi:DNA-binding PadR family transcriptional regulator
MATSATADGLGQFLPLTPVAFEILLALAGGDRHGYAILRDIEERASGRISPHPGTLYRAINRLMESGLLVELDERPAPELDDERRRYYRLTELGREVAVAEARRLEGQLLVARARKLLDRPTAARGAP